MRIIFLSNARTYNNRNIEISKYRLALTPPRRNFNAEATKGVRDCISEWVPKQKYDSLVHDGGLNFRRVRSEVKRDKKTRFRKGKKNGRESGWRGLEGERKNDDSEKGDVRKKRNWGEKMREGFQPNISLQALSRAQALTTSATEQTGNPGELQDISVKG